MHDAGPVNDDRAFRRLDAIRPALLRWYRRHGRTLPWRRPRPDPYHVLVSEAMLQQTQVATVTAYFARFIDRFPTVADLAAADEQEVLHLWQGLGYYRRARHLHAAARAIMGDHGGEIPREVGQLVKLPGIGRYTAGAVASIAFGERAPILDGNVARVLARWFAIDDPIDETPVRRRLWRLAEHLAGGPKPGDVNQALMDLGATVCTPRSPRCLTCPVASWCQANEWGTAEILPRRSARKPPLPVAHHVLAVRRRGRFVFQRRPDRGLWAGLWQLPTAEELGDEAEAGTVRDWAAGELGLRLRVPEVLDRWTHQTTHRTVALTLWLAEVEGGRLRPDAGRWRRLDALDDLPLARPQQRAVETVRRFTRASAGPG
jgi:A/G-specific adenine glycosylase